MGRIMPYRTVDEYKDRYLEVDGPKRAKESIFDPFKHDEQYHRRIVASSFVNEWILKNGLKKIKNKEKIRILDIGSGTDLFTYQWVMELNSPKSEYDVEYHALDCVDISDIIALREFKNLKPKVGDWRKLDNLYKEKQFDIILWLDGPEHETKASIVYRKINKILKDDGRVIISAPINCDAWGHARILNHATMRGELARFFSIQFFMVLEGLSLPECIAVLNKDE
jgi:SAM-dependent methyltransferase